MFSKCLDIFFNAKLIQSKCYVLSDHCTVWITFDLTKYDFKYDYNIDLKLHRNQDSPSFRQGLTITLLLHSLNVL